jgi:hypothetical protein
MKKLQDYLCEASISYKKKMEKFAKSMFKDECSKMRQTSNYLEHLAL